MVEFNKLIVIPYNKGLYIDCSILDMPYFKNVYIDKIVIDSQDTFNKDGISKNPIYIHTVSGNEKHLQLTIKNTELLIPNMENNMFFVFAIVKGLPSSDVHCGLDSPVTLGVGVDSYLIYRKALKYISETYCDCNIPKAFIDFILRYRAFQICLKTRDYPLAITYWKKFINSINVKSSNRCECNG